MLPQRYVLPDIFDGPVMQSFSLDAMIDVQTLPPTGPDRRLDATETERAELAQRFGYLQLTHLTRNEDQASCERCLGCPRKTACRNFQACIVTGKPVSESVDFEIEERYVLASVPEDEIVVDLGDAEPWSTAASI